MDAVQGLSGLLGMGLAAGVNLYAVVLTIGLAYRFGWVTQLPAGLEVLSHPLVLGLAGAMYLAEFVADKVPGFTPIWDGFHTFIRPIGGALLAFGATSNLDPALRVAAMLVGGSAALGAHATKMGTRLVAHAVPDPASHSVISVAEDVGAVGLIVLIYQYPLIAVPVVLLLVGSVGLALPFLYRVLRLLWQALVGRIFWRTAGVSDKQVLGYVRSGKGLGRLRRIWWRPEAGQLRLTGWLGDKSVDLAPDYQQVEGLFLDYVLLQSGDGRKISIYLTKDWGRLVRNRQKVAIA